MIYLKVKKSSDQISHKIRFKNNFFVANELYTQNEIKKSHHSMKFISSNLEEVNISPKNTHFIFGARFIKPLKDH